MRKKYDILLNKFVLWKERKKLCVDLKTVYRAVAEKEALHALDNFAEK